MKTCCHSQFWSSLFNPESVAVIGASSDPDTWGFNTMLIALASVKRNPRKRVYAVNPRVQEVMGSRSFASIADIPDSVDLAIIVVRADIVPSVMRQCVRKGVRAAVIISAGFAETGTTGARLQAEVVEISRQGGIRFVGPNCNGHFNFHSGVGSAWSLFEVAPGPVSVITQSGTLGGIIVQSLVQKGLGISKYISTGNEADLHFEDFLEFLAGDTDTHIITGYIEGLREGRRFYDLARAVTVKKPVIVIKTGTTERSGLAVRSHTGALAGSDAVYSAAFKQAGVIRVEDEEELCDVASLLVNMPLPGGNGVGILTIGGGFGVMAAEACERNGLRIPSLDPLTIEKMNAVLPPQWSHSNPVDIVNVLTLDNPIIPACLEYLLEDSNINIVITLFPPPTATAKTIGSFQLEQIPGLRKKYQEYLESLIRLTRKHNKPIIMHQTYFTRPAQEITSNLPVSGIRIPEFDDPRRIARALSHVVWYREYLERQ